MQQFKKILVVCPADTVTGGPEALHQLVAHMSDAMVINRLYEYKQKMDRFWDI
jgi:hypothetical protein